LSTPIERGSRGPGVEDVQKRLLRLGYDLGSSGVDGVFLGATLDAVRSFQHERHVVEDGVVGPETWSALVDATFMLGDRLLYLRFPYLHGADVQVLQGALNVLGFACGSPDGIFGAFTERAVREFQTNTGSPADGIVGPDTVRAVTRLRHVWLDKDPTSPVALAVAPARAAALLARVRIHVRYLDDTGRDVASRLANLALATEPRAAVVVSGTETDTTADALLYIGCDVSPADLPDGTAMVNLTDISEAVIEPRLITALLGGGSCRAAAVHLGHLGEAEETHQRLAVRMLDAVCAALTPESAAVVS
jgi:peptidoglycan hydrolase-like protein with peptidoglycan-binding domain